MEKQTGNYRPIVFGAMLLLLLVVASLMLLPFLAALLWATVLSILTAGLYERTRLRLSKVRFLGDGRSDSVASLLVTLMTAAIISVPFVVIGAGVFLQIGSMTSQLDSGGLSLETILKPIDAAIQPIADKVGADKFSLVTYVTENQAELVKSLQEPLKKFAGQAGFTILTLVFAILTQFFMLRDGKRLLEPALELSPLARDKTREILQRVIATVRAVFTGTVLVAVIQGIVIGITYALVGVPNSLLLGVVSAVLCIIPLLGAPVVYVPVGLLLFSQGKTNEALIVLAVGFLIVSQIDNVIKPFLIGGQVNLHPMAIFFSILGGVVLFGPIGVMAGPMLLTILLGFVEVLRASRSSEAVEELKIQTSP